jgi:hypothetical protein
MIETTLTIGGRVLRPGDGFQVFGTRGTFRFQRLVHWRRGWSWVECYGPSGPAPMFRAFYIGRKARRLPSGFVVRPARLMVKPEPKRKLKPNRFIKPVAETG